MTVDGFGTRTIGIDSETGDEVELLDLAPQLVEHSGFVTTVAERVARFAAVRHASYVHLRRLDRPSADRLQLVSDITPGWRLSELLEKSSAEKLPVDITVVIALLRQLLPAVALYGRHNREAAIGSLAIERLIVTTQARLVIAEHAFGPALEKLNLGRDRLWKELRVAMPPSAGLPRANQRSDANAIGVVALSLLLGRVLATEEYPADLLPLVDGLSEYRDGKATPLSASFKTWLSRALMFDVRTAFQAPSEAQLAFESVLASDRSYVTSNKKLDEWVSMVGGPLEARKRPAAEPDPEALRQQELERQQQLERQQKEERQRELERQQDEQRERERELELARLRELEQQRAEEMERLREQERQRALELERLREQERAREEEREREREKEKQEREREREKQEREREREKQEREREREAERQREQDRQRELERERERARALEQEAAAARAEAAEAQAAEEPEPAPAPPSRPPQPEYDPIAEQIAKYRPVVTPPVEEVIADEEPVVQEEVAAEEAPAQEAPAPYAPEYVPPAPESPAPQPTYAQQAPDDEEAPKRTNRMPLFAVAGVVLLLLAVIGYLATRDTGGGGMREGEGELAVTSRPPGARVVVDGKEVGVTPATVRLPSGPHVLEVQVGKAEPRVIPLTITAGVQTSQYIELRDVTATGSLEIRSEPSGARVTIDGQPRGTTPATVPNLTAGNHTVVLEAGGRKVSQVVKIDAGSTAQLVVPMPRK